MNRRRRSTIFSLPPEAFQCIATELNLRDLFTLSTCSKRSFNLVKNTAVLFETANFENRTELAIRINISVLTVQLNFKQYFPVLWDFCGKRIWTRYDVEDMPQISVEMNSGKCNQKTIVFGEMQRSDFGFYQISSNSLQDFFQFVEHISALFSAPVIRLEIEPGQTVHLKSILSVPILKNCLEVWIRDPRSDTISHDAMRRILEGFNCKKMRFHCNIDRNFNLPLKYSCESLFLSTSQVTYEHVNVFLHQWIRSEWKKPVDLIFCAGIITKEDESWGIYDDKCWQESENPETREEKWDLKKIAKGLTRYVITYLKNENVLVFQRETDGMELRLQIVNYQPGLRLYLYDNRKDHWTRRRVAIANQ